MNLSIFSSDYLHALGIASQSGRRRILVVSVLFICILVAGMSFLRSVFYFDNFQVMAVNTLSADTRVVGIGSSRMFFGIDPRMMPGHYTSLAANYLDMAGAERIWNQHEIRMPAVRMVLLEFGIATLYYDMYKLSPQALQPLGLDVFPEAADFLERPGHAIRLLLSPIFRWRLTPKFINTSRPMTHDPDEPQAEVAGHVPSKVRLAQPEMFAERKVAQTREHLQLFPATVFENNMKSLLRLIRRLDEKNIRVILVRFPKDKHVWPVYDPAWDQMVKEAHIAVGGAVGERELLDFGRDPRFLSAEFRDSDHLNREGARKLSSILAERISGDL